jgi:hypothetical protein
MIVYTSTITNMKSVRIFYVVRDKFKVPPKKKTNRRMTFNTANVFMKPVF